MNRVPLGATRTAVEHRTRWLLLVAVVVANVVGAVVVFVFATVVIPNPSDLVEPQRILLLNLAVFVAYLACAVPTGIAWGLSRFRPARRLAGQDRAPEEREQLVVLRGPLRLMVVHATLWGGAVVAAPALNVAFSYLLALKAGLTFLLGGVTTCTVVYLLAERLLRPASALALSAGLPRRLRLPGVAARAVLAWALGTAVPVLGLVFVAIAALAVTGISVAQLAVTILALGGTALTVGLGVTFIAAHAVADPIESVRRALARVERGDLDVQIPVYDGSEVGLLQAGFNRMAAGLREHEQLRDLFGRHVGEDVARVALQRGIELGGELREVTVIFVDLLDSTRLAATRSPDEVVTLLNAFFGIVVDVVDRHGGSINKFEGDAALAVFGAPLTLDDAPGRALVAARDLSTRLAEEVPQLQAGIGVSTGPAVAGNIGAEQRFEYTVIGDPVNEAARLTDLAKSTPERVLAAATVRARAHPTEAEHWHLGETVTLRGRTQETRLATPCTPHAEHKPP